MRDEHHLVADELHEPAVASRDDVVGALLELLHDVGELARAELARQAREADEVDEPDRHPHRSTDRASRAVRMRRIATSIWVPEHRLHRQPG